MNRVFAFLFVIKLIVAVLSANGEDKEKYKEEKL